MTQPPTIQGRNEHLWHASAGEVPTLDAVDVYTPSTERAWLEHIVEDDKHVVLPRTMSGLTKRVEQVDSTVVPIAGVCDCVAVDVRIISRTNLMNTHTHTGRDRYAR